MTADRTPGEAGPAGPPLRPAARVGTFTAACLLVSSMIGTGIFATTGFMARDLGSPVAILLLWLLGGIVALAGAAAYAELGAALPRAGGEYVYLRAAFGPRWGFLTGWASFAIGFGAAIASGAHLFATHLDALWPATGPAAAGPGEARHLLVALAMLWALTLVHLGGVGPGGLTQLLLTVVKVGAMAALGAAVLALGRGELGRLATGGGGAAPAPTLATALVSFLFVSYAYQGWNTASYVAPEIVRPARALPRAMLLGTAVVTVLYLALNLSYLYALTPAELVAEPIDAVAVKAAQAALGPGAGRWMAALVAVSIVGAVSALVWAGPRVYFAMARDGLFPRALGATDGRGTPRRAILLQSAWASVLVATGTYEALVVYSSFVLIACNALAVGALIVLRRRAPDLERPFRVPAYPWTPLLFLAVSAALLAAALALRPRESLLGVATVVGGLPLCLWFERRARRGGERATSR